MRYRLGVYWPVVPRKVVEVKRLIASMVVASAILIGAAPAIAATLQTGAPTGLREDCRATTPPGAVRLHVGQGCPTPSIYWLKPHP